MDAPPDRAGALSLGGAPFGFEPGKVHLRIAHLALDAVGLVSHQRFGLRIRGGNKRHGAAQLWRNCPTNRGDAGTPRAFGYLSYRTTSVEPPIVSLPAAHRCGAQNPI